MLTNECNKFDNYNVVMFHREGIRNALLKYHLRIARVIQLNFLAFLSKIF